MKQISSRDNPIVKNAVGLKQSKHRSQQKAFLLEGERSVGELRACPERVLCCFVQEELLSKYQYIVQVLGEERLYLTTDKIIKTICDTEHPQGIAAVVSKPDWDISKVLQIRGLWLVLNGISDPGNMGTMIRTARALGAAGLIYTHSSVDPYNPKAVRASMGSILTLPVLGPVSFSDITCLKDSGMRILGTQVTQGVPYFKANLRGNLLVVLGGEAQGMDREIIPLCDQIMNIPMNAGVNSLNAASACAIILSEAYKQRNDGII
ncbi:MAG: RNA methyltransferase [Syntrophomonadaceae bacterium]